MSTKTEDTVKTRFADDTAEHEMRILHDKDLFRVITFAKPGTFQYAYTLTTWPGYLGISGDMGTAVFARLPDMFEFFNQRTINEDYWHEKMVASGEGNGTTFDPDKARAYITEYLNEYAQTLEPDDAALLRQAVAERTARIDDETTLRHELNDFEHKGFRFEDTWEWDFSSYDYRFLWQLHAIRTGVERYWASK